MAAHERNTPRSRHLVIKIKCGVHQKMDYSSAMAFPPKIMILLCALNEIDGSHIFPMQN